MLGEGNLLSKARDVTGVFYLFSWSFVGGKGGQFGAFRGYV